MTELSFTELKALANMPENRPYNIEVLWDPSSGHHIIFYIKPDQRWTH